MMSTNMRSICLFFITFLCAATLFAAENIEGIWKRMNDQTGLRECVIVVYSYQDHLYGKIIATFDKDGKLNDTLDHPLHRAPGVPGDVPYCGLDFIWNLIKKGNRFEGKIIDPQKGGVYKAELWRKNDQLVIRGKLLFFGRNTIWIPALSEDLPPNFKEADIAQFVPKIP
jgi:uncharacterized protein (DUF2147 family)